MSVVVHHPRYGEIQLKVIPPGTLGDAEKSAAGRFLLEDLWLWGSSWAEFQEKFHEKGADLERAYTSAEQRGDVIGLQNVVARMKKWNDVADARWSMEDPEGFRDELVAREGQELLESIGKRLQRDKLREIKAANDARQQEFRRAEFRRIAKDLEARAPVPRWPLPTRFEPLVAFCAKKFGTHASEYPAIVITGTSDDRLRDGVSPRAYGCYVRDLKEIRLRADLPDNEIEKTLIHEWAHHYENLKGWLASEPFAYAQQEQLYREWLEERDAQELAA